MNVYIFIIVTLLETVLAGTPSPKAPPIWLMRQAGRYLPEYRAVRTHFPDFMEFCLTPDAVLDVTLQPIQRFDFDAAIIFCDLLILPHVMDQTVRFLPNHGPKLNDPDWNSFLEKPFEKNLVTPILEAITTVRARLDPSKALIGFAGAPWTLMRYMMPGGRASDPHLLVEFGNTDLGLQVRHKLELMIAQWLQWQIEAGCQVVQIFDSWAADAPPSLRDEWLFEPVQRIIESLPSHKVIYFGKGVEKEAQKITGCALAIGPSHDIVSFPSTRIVQGNLCPEHLVEGNFENDIDCIVRNMRGRPYIANLGHGILPQTPIQHVEKLIERVRCASHFMAD